MKYIIAFLLGLLILSGASFAQIYTPLPIAVKVESIPKTDIPVKITNLNTGESVQGLTNIYGEFVVDWANTHFKYTVGNTFRIESLTKVREFTYTGAPPEVFTFSFFEKICVVDKRLDYDEFFRIVSDECNVKVVAPPLPVQPEPTPLTEEQIVYLVVGFLLAVGITYKYSSVKSTLNNDKIKNSVPKGTGIKVYKKNDGSIELHHKHSGVTGYHNPDTLHSNELIRHPKGQLFPEYLNGRYVK